ncbi:insulin-like growth factor-binding protein complex acid labile subunit [Limulus polyphemus]|uniref:Insulin-like growth factor-binding protein complex acid labile subunit n=1 Tax=Limulus polyphemus TaxID=6850 RepID=A0ABM1BZX0_LIMPO|nr:insulin-like growth factor-binding protein complex acid labile subunit [Limulus polyphemus]
MGISTAFLILMVTIMTRSEGKCPVDCTCQIVTNRKTVACNKGGMTEIPINYMDLDTQVLIVTSPPENPNFLTIGRIFLHFSYLEEVYLTNSHVPAIGDSSFWPGRRIKILQLSSNNITLLHDQDFNGLTNLEVLDISDNKIFATPSAPFRFLTNLKSLSLARNRLNRLVPRFFYMLKKLEKLDLSGNPLKELDPENLKDLRPLKVLRLADCELMSLHSLVYQHLPNIQELDLRNNNFFSLAPEEFRHLKSLQILRLDGNVLSEIREKTFGGHKFKILGLSRNNIVKFLPCSFCNTSVKNLDVSHNRLSSLTTDVLAMVSNSLETFDLGFNPLDIYTVLTTVSVLTRLTNLSLAGMNIDKLLPDTFNKNPDLRYLNLSHNSIPGIPDEFLQPLVNIEILDLSHNKLQELSFEILSTLNNTLSLQKFVLHSNTWRCLECNVGPLLEYFNQSDLYEKICQHKSDCLRCTTPLKLFGRGLMSLHKEELERCAISFPQSHVGANASKVGTITAVVIIIILVLIIISAIMIYKRQSADYYTYEQERMEVTAYDNIAVVDKNGGLQMDMIQDSISSSNTRCEETRAKHQVNSIT